MSLPYVQVFEVILLMLVQLVRFPLRPADEPWISWNIGLEYLIGADD
jgi:hypothetical protein